MGVSPTPSTCPTRCASPIMLPQWKLCGRPLRHRGPLCMLHIDALSMGPEAVASAATSGRVLAVLRNALYLESEVGHVVAVVGAQAPDGPLALRVPGIEPVLPALTVSPGATFQGEAEALQIAAG